MIRNKFGANYIFADAKENTDMIAKALDSGWAEMIYQDQDARILKIRETKVNPKTPQKAKNRKPTKKTASSTKKSETPLRTRTLILMTKTLKTRIGAGLAFAVFLLSSLSFACGPNEGVLKIGTEQFGVDKFCAETIFDRG